MEYSHIFMIAIAGVSFGYFLSWFIHRRNIFAKKEYQELKISHDRLLVEHQLTAHKLELKNNDFAVIKMELDVARETIIDLNRELACSQSDLKNLGLRLNEQQHEIENIRQRFLNEFKTLATEVLSKETETFTAQNLQNIESILKPLSEKIKDFEKKVGEVYDKESQQRFSLKEEVQRLSELNGQISRDAQNLTAALKGETKTQGNWGELVLENILEKSGLAKGREFVVQQSYQTESGKRLQPDVVLYLPGNRNIVVDSKVSLTAYERFTNADEETEKSAALKGHLISVKKHIDELAAKNYQNIYSLNTLDFVIMFLPVEPAYFTALHHDSDLWHYAYKKGVLLVGPTNLITTLKMIVNLWQQEYQTRNVKRIAEESGRLYDKFAGFLKDLKEIGLKLTAAQNAYSSAMNKLTDGKGNLLAKAIKLKELGANTKNDIVAGFPELLEDHQSNNE
jgi:DNA recombination protein RmuC